jgi:hypothetical protein
MKKDNFSGAKVAPPDNPAAVWSLFIFITLGNNLLVAKEVNFNEVQ